MNALGVGFEGSVRGAEDAEDHGGGGGKLREPLGESGSAGPMAVFVPPAVFEKEDAVFDLPVIADGGQQLVGADRAGIEAGEEVARIGKAHGAVIRDHVAVDAERDLAAGKAERVAEIGDVL